MQNEDLVIFPKLKNLLAVTDGFSTTFNVSSRYGIRGYGYASMVTDCNLGCHTDLLFRKSMVIHTPVSEISKYFRKTEWSFMCIWNLSGVGVNVFLRR
jgi:hypothetical protein